MTEEAEKIVKHLEMIQGVINRMAHNSFLLKGWAVTLVAASFWLTARFSGNWTIGIGMPILTLLFWGLDGFYLRQERLFRHLYDSVRMQERTDFSMDTRPFANGVQSVVGVCRSVTLLPFYGVLLMGAFLLLWMTCGR